jgi:hypothetical protein
MILVSRGIASERAACNKSKKREFHADRSLFRSHPDGDGFFCSVKSLPQVGLDRACLVALVVCLTRLTATAIFTGLQTALSCLAKTGLGGSARGLAFRSPGLAPSLSIRHASGRVRVSTIPAGMGRWRAMRFTIRRGRVATDSSHPRTARPKNCPACPGTGAMRSPDSRLVSYWHGRGGVWAFGAADGCDVRPPLDRQFETVRSGGRPNERKMSYESKRDFADRRCDPSG